MPVQTAQTSLAAQYGARLDQAVKAAAPAQPEAGFQRLPGGIPNGVARLTKCGFAQVKPGKQMAGEWYYRAEGVVIEPEFNDKGVRVAGLTTSVMIMVCQTMAKASGNVTTIEENVAAIENEMKLLGVPPESFTGSAVLEPIAAALQKTNEPGQKPIFFRFSSEMMEATTQYPNPRVFEHWHGRIENYTPPTSSRGMADKTGAPSPATQTAPAGKPPAAPPPTTTAAPEFNPSHDELTDLGVAAANGDKKAEDAIFARAIAAGVADEAKNAADWPSAAAIVAQAEASGGGVPAADASGESEPEPDVEPEPEPEPDKLWEPEAGQVAKWSTKEKGKAVKKDVEIIKAFATKRSAYIKDLVNGKPVLGKDGKANLAVSWDVLEPA